MTGQMEEDNVAKKHVRSIFCIHKTQVPPPPHLQPPGVAFLLIDDQCTVQVLTCN